jgi:hypothetical protein
VWQRAETGNLIRTGVRNRSPGKRKAVPRAVWPRPVRVMLTARALERETRDRTVAHSGRRRSSFASRPRARNRRLDGAIVWRSSAQVIQGCLSDVDHFLYQLFACPQLTAKALDCPRVAVSRSRRDSRHPAWAAAWRSGWRRSPRHRSIAWRALAIWGRSVMGTRLRGRTTAVPPAGRLGMLSTCWASAAMLSTRALNKNLTSMPLTGRSALRADACRPYAVRDQAGRAGPPGRENSVIASHRRLTRKRFGLS